MTLKIRNETVRDQHGRPWWENPDVVLHFAGILKDAGVLTTPGKVIYYFEKPWKYDVAMLDWIRAGQPEALSDPNWEPFVENI